ncbi:S-adenosylmethionine decarboxylase proenzyme [Spizellomyces punctatus DAOM BR117]|uniref:adenosylmethionine decarboxylase n=1 Tax=Spizellomyces punctatus (strain DAOM BR117) TaxID=645134 RepID=A0A0L0H4A9_SPIPD|nr:S-adenosylmethionine decarboxylase proenzyme [Spizellomyces punctatus DAOM BR117]KNC95809.1 S-adenosylmethionine decarboxylase proenzyme [Spizellomyces punctatus DAOM BR117]|eukprot:XP_016603849.1 S-adenosylmethionine decarboxylase proenzyme [Spizellomyces punctatus DAOM BR117]
MIIKESLVQGLNSHLYSSTYPKPLPSESAEQHTLCGFEGPEKVLEIWFRPVNGKESPILIDAHRAVAREVESLSEDDVSVGDIDEIVDCARPKHDYPVDVFQDNHGRWQYRRSGLRLVDRAVWEEMLRIVKCQVLNVVNNECVDAYLLSESSMFVYPHRLILKTCGTTTLLHAVPKILDIAREYCGFHDVNAVFYSRKAFLFPEKQVWPHGRWGDEVSYLDKLFCKDEFETAGYVLGKINGDHWCLYMCTPHRLSLDLDGVELAESSSSHDSDAGSSINEEEEEEDDVTLEILMTQLDPAAMKAFWRTAEELRAAKDGKDISQEGAQRVYHATGIADIYPKATVDDYLFDPCGYSLNGLLGPYYFTIHVTPEDVCSYASFETTVPVKRFYSHIRAGSESEYDTFEDVIQRVVSVFRPGTFSTTLISRKSVGHKHGKTDGLLEGHIGGFRRRDRIVQCLGKWDLVFCHYDRHVDGTMMRKGTKTALR